MALPWLRRTVAEAAGAVAELDGSSVRPYAAALHAALFDEKTGSVRPIGLVLVLLTLAAVLFVAADGASFVRGKLRSDSESEGSAPPADGEAENAPSQGSGASREIKAAGSKASKKPLSTKALLARARRAERAKDRVPDSEMYWKSFGGKRRAVTAAALSAGSGKHGPSWVAVAEQDLAVRATLLSRDGAGAAVLTRAGASPRRCGEVTALAIGGVRNSPPTAVAPRRAAAGKARSPGGVLVAATMAGGPFVVVWSLDGDDQDLGAPSAVLDVSGTHPGRISRLLAPCLAPGSPASVVAFTMAVGSTRDTVLGAFSVPGAGARAASPGDVTKARPVDRFDVAQARNYDVAISQGRRWLAAATHMSGFRVIEAGLGGGDGTALSRLSRARTLAGADGGHHGRGAGVAFVAPGVAPVCSLVAGAAGDRIVVVASGAVGACAGRGDAARAVAVSRAGQWSVWDLDVPDGSSPAVLETGRVDTAAAAAGPGPSHPGAATGASEPAAAASASDGAGEAGAAGGAEAGWSIDAVRALPGSPLRLAAVLVHDAAPSAMRLVVLALTSGSGPGSGPRVAAAGSAYAAGDAIVLRWADMSGLGPIADMQLSDAVSDGTAAGALVAGVDAGSKHGAAAFERLQASKAAAWPSFLLTVHAGAMSARTWRLPAANECFVPSEQ